MKHSYLLWATGEDRSGIVAAVTKVLFDRQCNLEDSSMMRLGSEFAIFLIFSSPEKIGSNLKKWFSSVEKKFSLSIGLKPLTNKQARFKTVKKNLMLVTVHGVDRPGIVYRVTEVLARRRFNITDLSTHRTTGGAKPGYILFIEGEMAAPRSTLERDLQNLKRQLKTHITLRTVPTESI